MSLRVLRPGLIGALLLTLTGCWIEDTKFVIDEFGFQHPFYASNSFSGHGFLDADEPADTWEIKFNRFVDTPDDFYLWLSKDASVTLAVAVAYGGTPVPWESGAQVAEIECDEFSEEYSSTLDACYYSNLWMSDRGFPPVEDIVQGTVQLYSTDSAEYYFLLAPASE